MGQTTKTYKAQQECRQRGTGADRRQGRAELGVRRAFKGRFIAFCGCFLAFHGRLSGKEIAQ